jgi:hypothetical protein
MLTCSTQHNTTIGNFTKMPLSISLSVIKVGIIPHEHLHLKTLFTNISHCFQETVSSASKV